MKKHKNNLVKFVAHASLPKPTEEEKQQIVEEFQNYTWIYYAMMQAAQFALLQLKDNPLTDMIKEAGPIAEKAKIYTALSPALKISESLKIIIDEGLKRMRKNGELEKICHKYGFNLWQE